jgi:hypothetical protein
MDIVLIVDGIHILTNIVIADDSCKSCFVSHFLRTGRDDYNLGKGSVIS